MTSVLHPYATLKSSGVHWLCHVPEHWHVRRLRTVAEMRVSNVDKHTKEEEFPVRLCNYVDVYKNDRITQGIPFMSATASKDEIEKFRLNRNDVVITKDSEAWDDIGVPSLVTEPADDLISGYHLAIIRPREDTYGPYLFWALRSKPTAYQFHVEAKGVTRYGLAHHGIQSALIPHPPLSEQKAIVRFLDHADEQTQRYIASKERLIALLEEERQALVHQAVTRGLDPSVRLKPSGMEWLGDVPEHWEVRRLKQISVIQTGITIGPTYDEEGLIERSYLRVANVQSDHLDLSKVTTIRVSPAEIKRATLQAGDVLMTEGGDIDKLGRGCVWLGEIPDCLHQNHVFAVRPDPKCLNPEFLVALMGSFHTRTYFYVTAKQTTNLAATNRTTLGNLPMCLPCPDEQLSILEFITAQCRAQNDVIERTRRQIDLMNDYRTRLIADVVTGQLDVREAAAQHIR